LKVTREVKGRVRGRRSTQKTTRRRSVFEESVPITKLPGRKDPFWKEVYGGSGRKKRRLFGKNDGENRYIELGGVGEDRGQKSGGYASTTDQ
jgi:hypothetical protein